MGFVLCPAEGGAKTSSPKTIKTMENTFMLDLSLKFGLTEAQTDKVIDIIYQALHEIDKGSQIAQQVALFVCNHGLVDKPMDDILEELRVNKLID